MKITHLRVFRHKVIICWVSANTEPIGVNHCALVSLGSFKNLKFYVFDHLVDSEFAKAHLEHHALFQLDFVPDHEEGAGGAAEVFEVEVAVAEGDFAVFSRDEGFGDDDVV